MIKHVVYVNAIELSNAKMVAGNENRYIKVIDGEVVKEWVGFGWIELRTASRSDKLRYPHVQRI